MANRLAVSPLVSLARLFQKSLRTSESCVPASLDLATKIPFSTE
ncbi:hypothetical protein MG5_03112 [Candida albicans P57072]|uniref:Uncharacterized protein n=1 Tax=Candida albicans P78048 TaxID=1094989 RepID=A0AB34PSP7_CANAX|nr:hypothetical protein MEO_03055 [Candida albicans P94015]KGR08760.1 hypothetical protein MG5_03112 [Candida albicans P57072]KGR10370.1 hypothetical protein MG3_03124 [Candida albicans P78048]KGR16736.1 hypothetical protein MG9_03083 [Candida albicans P37037]KGT69190.1 hypothetical protein MEK_03105 [Candida albicans 12C]KGU10521.1 hypothetical protein MEY_03047 [Candida albicans 19F]KGU26509.1 hypothetical protein MG7_03088 [Candida albicans P34048]KGU29649.1 putative peptidyl-prolyl cis-t